MTPAKILVVDDEPHVRQVLEMKLGESGYEVRACADGPTALTTAAAFKPDLVISDFHMPGGMSGADVLHSLRNRRGGARLPMILLTGSMDAADQLEMQMAGDELLRFENKPFSPRVLMHLIEELLAKSLPKRENTFPT